MKIEELVRANIRKLKPYSSAREEFSKKAEILLDANENAFDTEINRYPDPLQKELRGKLAKMKNLDIDQVFVGNGSDEVIDLLFRAFCEPRKDNVIILPPTYGMYKVSADINDVEYREIPLNEEFSLNVGNILSAVDENTKMIFICSPNNPTGNSMNEDAVQKLLDGFKGIVVIDEAYIDFSENISSIKYLDKYFQLIVLQTFSKSKGAAGLRLGVGYSSPEIIDVLMKIKPPYNVNYYSQRKAVELLDEKDENQKKIDSLIEERNRMEKELKTLKSVQKIFPSDANFLLVRFIDADEVYQYLLKKGIVVRNRSKEAGCENCLRITIGTKEQNEKLINRLKTYSNEEVITD